MVQKSVVLSFLTLLIATLHGKVYNRCELARELFIVHKSPINQLATWVCIAQLESGLNTTIMSKINKNGSRDHGIFQINSKYWCSPPGKGCGLPCYKMRDDNITDDFECVQKIYEETKKIKKDGFKAWVVYQRNCTGSKANKYIKGCF